MDDVKYADIGDSDDFSVNENFVIYRDVVPDKEMRKKMKAELNGGSPAYMATEVLHPVSERIFNYSVDHLFKIDVWAAGCVAYCMHYRCHPFII